MPPYIQGYCDQQLPPPYFFKGVSVWSFPLAARYSALKTVVDRYLNLPSSGLDFKPLGNRWLDSAIVYMMVLHYDRMLCQPGFLSQNEFYFAIPFVRTKEDGMPDFGLFTPCIFVDNSWSMLCGNTVVGYPKQLAWFRMPGEGANPYPIEIDAPVFAAPPSPNTPLTWQRVLSVTPSLLGLVETAVEDFVWPFGNVDFLFGPQGSAPVEADFLGPLRKLMAGGLYSLAQLKQIRDAVQADAACYQAVMNYGVGLDSPPVITLLPGASIDLPEYPSLRIGEELGLIYAPNGKLIPIFPYRVDCDFSIIDPVVLYSATSTPAASAPRRKRGRKPG
jgi:hypothetical protein